MRIPCPHCGARDLREFSFLGDAKPARPDPDGADAVAEFNTYVYIRNNPRGRHEELWYHGAGCQTWLVVERDTRTHAVTAARACRAIT
jgi:heterotetrameric sarcosine oxidase delta subunit